MGAGAAHSFTKTWYATLSNSEIQYSVVIHWPELLSSQCPYDMNEFIITTYWAVATWCIIWKSLTRFECGDGYSNLPRSGSRRRHWVEANQILARVETILFPLCLAASIAPKASDSLLISNLARLVKWIAFITWVLYALLIRLVVYSIPNGLLLLRCIPIAYWSIIKFAKSVIQTPRKAVLHLTCSRHHDYLHA